MTSGQIVLGTLLFIVVMHTQILPSAELPTPSVAYQQLSQQLQERIALRIAKAGGTLRFDHYMNMALYEPQLGYYRNGLTKLASLAQGGDFVTAPLLSPIFAKALAHTFSKIFSVLVVNDIPPTIYEFGAGDGTLAAQLIANLAPDWPSLHYHIIELSADLQERQRQTIYRRCSQWLPPSSAIGENHLNIQWLNHLPNPIDGIVFGNEVLDALPIRMFDRPDPDHPWREVAVTTLPQGGLGWQLISIDEPPPHLQAVIDFIGHQYPYRIEMHPYADALMTSIAESLRHGVALWIDYGFNDQNYYHPDRFEGSLMCHYQHRTHSDVFYYPGLQDITAHVNFSAINHAAIEAGMIGLGYVSQARFLLNQLPAWESTIQLNSQPPSVNTVAQQSQLQILLSEAEMGELFKVIAFGKGLGDSVALDAFSIGNRLYTL